MVAATEQRTLASQDLFFIDKWRKILDYKNMDYSDAGLDIQETLGTLQIVSFHVLFNWMTV